jgi:hypothetical protein
MAVLAFLAPVIHGHSNVHLTIYRRLLALSPAEGAPAHIHILGDEPLRKRVAQLPFSEHTAVSFHALDPVDVFASGAEFASLRTPPLSAVRRGGTSGLRNLMPIMFPPADVYLHRYERIVEVLREAKPDIVIADVLFANLGVDACHTLNLRYAILAPIGSLDMSTMTQPGGRGMWKYPMPVLASLRLASH